MDLGTIIGVVAGFGLIIGSIAVSGSLRSFFDLPSILIVVGGTVAATLIAQQLKAVKNAMQVALNAIRDRSPSREETIANIEKLAARVRKEGLLALENVKLKDSFMAKGVRLAVDGASVEVIRAALIVERDSLLNRHDRGQRVFRFMGGTAPAMGMLGTLIGLVQMLKTLDDPSTIGPSMAVALLTTFYGAVLAYLIFIPLADKLELRTKDETTNMRIVIEGIESVMKGENALLVREKVEAFLAPKDRKQAAKKRG